MRSLARLGPDQAGQPLGAAAARDDAEQDLGLAEPRLLAGDAEVARQRQLAAAAEREPGDGRDGGARDVGHRVERAQEQLADQLGLGAGDHLVGRLGRAELGDLGAGREDAVAAGDDDGARRVVAQRLGDGRELAQHRLRQRVDLGVVEAHDGHAVVAPLEVHQARHGAERYPVAVEEPLGGRPRVDAPGGHLGRQVVEGRPAGRQGPLVEQRGDDADELVLHPRRPRAARASPVELEVLAVVADRRPQLGARPRRWRRWWRAPAGASRRVAVRSSMRSRSRRVSSAPGRSALLITNTSAISSRPALLACTASPQPGFTTTTVVSAAPATSTSTWPTPTVSIRTHGQPDGVEHPHGLEGGQREAAEVAAGGHRADEHAVVGGVVGHAHPVAEDGAAGERRRRVDGEHGDRVARRPRDAAAARW